MSRSLDPFERAPVAGPVRFLYRLNPLAKLAAVLPATILLVFVRDAATPLVFLTLAYATLLVGARFSGRLLAVLALGIPLGVLVIGAAFSAWIDPSLVHDARPAFQWGAWTLTRGALAEGYATALRLAAIISLALVAGLTTTGPDLARSLVQQLRVPYRVGYTALAAFRFVPRFAEDLEVIRHAHRVRGSFAGRSPLAAVRRWAGYVVPLLAGSIRHAERVALAMDARAFGAYPTRTERHRVPFRMRDVVFVVLSWAASALVFAVLFPWGIGG